MRYNLVLHANGPEPKDYNIYLNESEDWFRLGRIQNIHFKARYDSFIPEISGGFIGITVSECPKPDLSDGIAVTYLDFANVKEDSTIASMNIFIQSGEKPIGMVHELDVDVDVKGNAKIRLQAPEIVEWKDDIPEWVELNLIPLEND